jgi:hypothetical protein
MRLWRRGFREWLRRRRILFRRRLVLGSIVGSLGRLFGLVVRDGGVGGVIFGIYLRGEHVGFLFLQGRAF